MSLFGNINFLFEKIISTGFIQKITQPLLKANKIEHTITRGFKAENFYNSRGIFSNDLSQRGRHYQAKILKRMKTHGLETRLESRGGKQILWRKILKGKKGWPQLVTAP